MGCIITPWRPGNTIPRPDVVLFGSLICDNNAKIGEAVCSLTGSTGFFIDYPFQHSDRENDYLKQELKEMIVLLESQSGQKMDWARLEQSIARANRGLELFRQIDMLRRNIPSSFPSVL